ncbi:hypothetical protein FDG2_6119 [Candidatus Protofrankia californiensis]|uniref:Uncharacterized protein n=1 Tax=Candidatus Protofrankia californiensis TaxID=1839754 RepID=A0A1C3PGB9_9ACTN|nr:hypothetical protein FDG2_6119 [Candidatus Protofrankia californiensis]
MADRFHQSVVSGSGKCIARRQEGDVENLGRRPTPRGTRAVVNGDRAVTTGDPHHCDTMVRVVMARVVMYGKQ